MEQLQDTILAYLNGQLEGEARAVFETQLLTDKALAEEVAFHRRLYFTIKHQKTLQFNAAIHALRETVPLQPDFNIDPQFLPKPQNGGAINGLGKWGLWASSIALVALLSIGGWVFYQNTAYQHLLIETAEQYKAKFTFADALFLDPSKERHLANAMTFYRDKNYKAALEEFKIEDAQTRNYAREYPQTYQAICYLLTNQSQKAIDLFESLLSMPNVEGSHSSVVKWYLALSYLSVGNDVVAKKHLADKSVQNDPDLGDMAKSILNTLKTAQVNWK